MLASLIAASFALPIPASVADLEKHPEKYHNRFVRIELVLKDLTPGESWSLQIGEAKGVDVIGRTTPPGKNGDKVAARKWATDGRDTTWSYGSTVRSDTASRSPAPGSPP